MNPEFKQFTNTEIANKFLNDLQFEESTVDGLQLAFGDIFNSFSKIYFDLLPKFMASKNKEELEDLFFEMRSEFQHIDYHIKDADLFEIQK